MQNYIYEYFEYPEKYTETPSMPFSGLTGVLSFDERTK